MRANLCTSINARSGEALANDAAYDKTTKTLVVWLMLAAAAGGAKPTRATLRRRRRCPTTPRQKDRMP